jgi:ABC-type transport system substrate-binding protein/serine/threonine protein kinase
MVDRVGQQLGNYRLVKMLGQGGYAEVYLGQHVRFKQQAAIKVLHAHLTEQEAQHFQQEAETIATLAHPGIIRVLDFDVQDGIPFLVIDYAPNGSLRQRYPKGSLVPLPVIISSVKQVTEALQYAHEQKFIHRDVKPENMLVGRRQEVLLSDFGIATIAHNSSSLGIGTEGASGTLAYMAPEQIEGHPRAASDQYALGIVVYEWLCGERPFEGPVSELIAQQLSVSPLPLHERMPSIPAGVEQVVLQALSKDPKARFASVQDFSTALEQASQHALAPTGQLASEQSALSPAATPGYETVAVAPDRPILPSETTPSADLPVGAFEPTVYPETSTPHGLGTPQSGAVAQTSQSGQVLAPTAAVVSPPIEPTMPVQRKARRVSRTLVGLLIGLMVVVIAGGILGSVSLLTHFGVLGAHSSAPTITPVHGGTWTIGTIVQPDSFIPFSGNSPVNPDFDQALYLPLFYSDGYGAYHPGAASVVPSVSNGGISPDAKTWTFHMRPHLVWSDGAPYDARDLAFSIKLELNPQFNPGYVFANYYIGSDDVSADHLSITIHLKHSYAPFLAFLMDGFQAPLPAHHFGSMAPGQVLKSPDLLDPQVTSGPFLMAESAPGNHFTLVRNPRYYLASKGLPYLDKVVFRILSQDALNQGLQAGTIDSITPGSLDRTHMQVYQHLHNYALVTTPINAVYDALYFDFHNQVLASHLEVREAIAMAINNQALINYENTLAPGLAIQQCTDHSAFYHPGFDPAAPCQVFNPAAANQLLDDHGWVKGPDGVRTKGGQRLEFEFSAPIGPYFVDYLTQEAIIQHDLQAVGIKLDIQNYSGITLFLNLLNGGNASPPTGAVVGRFDIAEVGNYWNWDPDDSSTFGCLSNGTNPNGSSIDFYCNPALDALYQQELATPDPGARQNLFEQIHLIYLTDFPFIVLFGEYDLYVVRKGTHNFQPSPISITDENIAQWWCDNGKC